MRAYSRHFERRGNAATVTCGITPGGKTLSRADELLDQAGHKQLSLQPSPGTVLVKPIRPPRPECCWSQAWVASSLAG